jgi:apoptosis-inducing factor 2
MAYKAGLHPPVIAKNIQSLINNTTPKAIYTPASSGREMIALPLGKTGGLVYVPFFGGFTLGDFFAKMLKGKDLFVPKQNALLKRY